MIINRAVLKAINDLLALMPDYVPAPEIIQRTDGTTSVGWEEAGTVFCFREDGSLDMATGVHFKARQQAVRRHFRPKPIEVHVWVEPKQAVQLRHPTAVNNVFASRTKYPDAVRFRMVEDPE